MDRKIFALRAPKDLGLRPPGSGDPFSNAHPRHSRGGVATQCTLQGLDDAPFGDGFVVGKVPLPLRFLFDQAVCAVRVRQSVRRCHLQRARRVLGRLNRGV